jgi:hypothetical protein
MNGRANMEIKQIVIDQLNGTQVRQLASKLMKSNDGDRYLVFIQRFDSDIKPEPYHCVSVVFR